VRLNVKHIIFLSVQGVEKSKLIPHYKIERAILASKIGYTFLRPAYFMQNFTTNLLDDLVKHQQVFLPAGHAKFTLVDVRNIGEVAALILNNSHDHINRCYELTSNTALTFTEMASILTAHLGENITYTSPSLLGFYLKKRHQGIAPMFILVMMMLHYLPRFQKAPKPTNDILTLTGNAPITFEQFVFDHKNLLNPALT
jgi:uncharacterized protein YbjT (DUF2867 family)